MIWTTVTAVAISCVRYLPGTIVVALLGVFTLPFAILFAAIAFSPQKDGHLSVNQGLLKILVAAWFVCLAITASSNLLFHGRLVF